MTSLALMSFMAGNVAVLSPCVLPAVPFIVSSALEQHKLGPLAVSMGLLTSFTAIGVSIAMFGSFFGLEQELVKIASAWMLILMGITFISSKVQGLMNVGLNQFANHANGIISSKSLAGLKDQYLLGLLVGAVWSPCIGPTLGSALALAGQTESRYQGSSLILVYGLGIVIPFLIIGYGTRFMGRRKAVLMSTANQGKVFLGVLMIIFGISVLTGMDKIFEGILFDLMPVNFLSWLTSF